MLKVLNQPVQRLVFVTKVIKCTVQNHFMVREVTLDQNFENFLGFSRQKLLKPRQVGTQLLSATH